MGISDVADFACESLRDIFLGIVAGLGLWLGCRG